MATEARKADANPTKSFFVRMLTRDISLDDCILDLIDNSVDGAWKTTGADPSELTEDSELASFSVNIRMDGTFFEIRDNCGGITLDDAVNYAFTFGRRENQSSDGYSVGVYGIGMKRALFKIGQKIEIASTYREETDLFAFAVPIDVAAWLADEAPSWDFDIEDFDPADEPGVAIRVDKLSDETRDRLADPSYENRLRRILGRDYMVPLMRGLSISVNGKAVAGAKIGLRQNSAFLPMRNTYTDGEVKVEIIAGMHSIPPDDTPPDERRGVTDPSGWYMICNGRVVVAEDKTILTGWADSWPKWHPQYTGFAGFALFSARDAELLPMTTTKRSVDVASAIYRRAIAKMKPPTETWIAYTNARKQDEELKQAEDDAFVVELSKIKPNPSLTVPPRKKTTTRKLANVSYAVRLDRLQRLASALGDINMSYRDVGLGAFEYATAMLIDEEDE